MQYRVQELSDQQLNAMHKNTVVIFALNAKLKTLYAYSAEFRGAGFAYCNETAWYNREVAKKGGKP